MTSNEVKKESKVNGRHRFKEKKQSIKSYKTVQDLINWTVRRVFFPTHN